MEKRVVLSIVITILVIVVQGVYMNFEPQRQASAAQRQRQEAVERGATQFAALCTGCHGVKGEGVVGPKLADGAFLERRGLPPGDTSSLRLAETQMRKTTARGVAKTAMPAWGVDEGGSLNDEQILEIATFLLYGGNDAWQEVAALAPTPTPAPPRAPAAAASASGSDLAAKGRQLFQDKGCFACHGPNAEGGAGPGLAGKTEAELLKQVRTPRGAMPPYPPDRLSDDEVHSIAAFIESLSKN
ncbi:MAG: c-type cytochrome [Dehalococcoidia bacterium]|nr:c-type cytochrome [Dehalococcoidia bacterium]